MTDIGELVVRIKADATQLEQEMRNANSAVKESSHEISESAELIKDAMRELLPAISVGAFIEFGKGAIEAAAHLQDVAERIGFTGATLSALNIPLKLAGSNVEEFSASINVLNTMIGAAASGNQEAVKRFDKLGLSVMALKRMSPEQAFFAVAQALGQLNDQFELADNGRALLGRGFASLGSTIKNTKGDIQGFVETAQKLGNSLTQEEIDKVHEYEDAWTLFIEHLKIKVVEGVSAFEEFMKKGKELGESLPSFADRSEEGLDHWGNKIGPSWEEKQKSIGGPLEATMGGAEAKAGINAALKARGLPGFLDASNPAKGSNAGLLQGQTQQLSDTVADYIQNLQNEVDALGKSSLALDVYRAQKEAAGRAIKEYNAGLRDTPQLTDDEKSAIALSVDELYIQKQAMEEVRKEQEKQIQIVAQMENQVADSLAQAAIDYKNFGATATSVLQQIAKQIIELEITQPLVSSITKGVKGSGFFSSLFGGSGGADEAISPALAAADPTLANAASGGLFGGFFAGGGDPPVGLPSIVGEDGPEIFVPKTAGTVIPNGQIGGRQVIVQQNIQIYPGVDESVSARIREAAPAIAAQAHASVFQAMRQGGSESRIAGLRS